MKSCPVCHLMLQAIDWDGPPAWVCTSCGGHWAAGPDAPAVAARSGEITATFPSVVSVGMYEGLPMSCPQCRIARLEPAEGVTPGRWLCAKCGGIWMATGLTSQAPAGPPVEEPASAPEPAADEAAEFGGAASGPESPDSGGVTTDQAPDTGPAASLSAQEQAIVDVLREHAPTAEPTPATTPAGLDVPDAPWRPPSTPDEALECLQEGNRRYRVGAAMRPRQGASRRAETAKSQSPFAAIVGCCDSRVPPEIIFDQGLGDLFTIRDAGHIVDATSQASLAYAVDVLGVRLVLVLGHKGCGAVQVTVQGGGHYPYMQTVIDEIAPAVDSARSLPGDPSDTGVRENVRRVVTQLLTANWMIADRVRKGRIAVVGAVYDVATGYVEFMPDLKPFEAPGLSPGAHSEPVPPAVPEPARAPAEVRAEPATSCLDGSVAAPRSAVSGPASTVGGGSTAQTPPVGPQTQRAVLWCPQCRAGYGSEQRYCVRCGVPLVPGNFRVPCLACRRENTIEAARCWACSLDMHPTPAQAYGRSSPPAIPGRTQHQGGRAQPSRASDSCATQVVAVTIIGLAATALPHVLAGVSRLLGGGR